MLKKQKKFYFSRSMEEESIVRKFSILFLVVSLIPLLVLFYIYLQIHTTGTIQINEESFFYALLFVVLGVLVGYDTMRRMVVRMVDVLDSNRSILMKVLSPAKVKELSTTRNEIAILAKSFSAITNQLEENVKELEKARKTIYEVMNKVAQGLSNMDNIDSFLDLILETVTDSLQGTVGALILVDSGKKDYLTVKSVYGIADEDFHDSFQLRVADNPWVSEIIKKKSPGLISDFVLTAPEDKNWVGRFDSSVLCAPLLIKDFVIGIMVVSGSKSESGFDDGDLNLLFNLASQTAVAIENARLNQDIESIYFETISALALAVDAKDRYSRGHLDRVSRYSVAIGKHMGLENVELKMLRDAAVLHDLGKIGVPDDVLGKKDRLTDEEWNLMRKHPQIGESIIKPIKSLAYLCDIIRHHHEKLDGSGYPDGLKGESIAPLVRILAVADVFDALTSDRSYREKSSFKEGVIILREMGGKIDQDIVNIFEEYLLLEDLV